MLTFKFKILIRFEDSLTYLNHIKQDSYNLILKVKMSRVSGQAFA